MSLLKTGEESDHTIHLPIWFAVCCTAPAWEPNYGPTPLYMPHTSTTEHISTPSARLHMKPGSAKSQIYDILVRSSVTVKKAGQRPTENNLHCYHVFFLCFCSTNKNVMYYNINSKQALDKFHYGNPPELRSQMAKKFIDLVANDHLKKEDCGRPNLYMNLRTYKRPHRTQLLPQPLS
jgi:hypothetical protein